jgi:hypothetical protein
MQNAANYILVAFFLAVVLAGFLAGFAIGARLATTYKLKNTPKRKSA